MVTLKTIDTIYTMYTIVDDMTADQLEVGDFIGIANEVVRVLDVIPQKNGYIVMIENDFGDSEFVHLGDFETVPFFVED